MNHHTLREIAKVGVGLVIADIVCGLWFAGAGLFPITILGVAWSANAIGPAIVFDLALIILLAHFAWNMRLPISSPSERTLLQLAGVIFLVVALGHLARLMFNANLILGGFEIPMWLSWAGVIVTAYLSYASFHFAGMRRR
jgi:hypothetical protein